MSRLFVSIARPVLFGLLLAGGFAADADELPVGWIAEGSPAATPFYVNQGRMAGPTVILVGGMHGNEPAGAAAAEQIRHWPIRRGKLVIIPRANIRALAANIRTLAPPDDTNRFDLNRAFPPKVGVTNLAVEWAQSFWALVRTNQPHWLVDLHEGGDFRAQTRSSVGSSVIPSFSPEARRVGDVLVRTINASITATNRQFMLLSQPIKGSLARAVADTLGVRSMIVETTTKSQPLSLRTRQHRIAVHALLHELNMLDERITPERLMPASLPPGTIRVAVYDGAGVGGKGVPNVLAQLGAWTNVITRRVSPEDIRAGVLGRFDVVVFTGGMGGTQGRALAEAGRKAVKDFVTRGGGYLGICAGAYLACQGPEWALGIIDARTLSPLWRRGREVLKLELTERGRAIFGERPGQFDCLYNQGPIVGPAEVASVPDYEALTFFRTEVAKNNTPQGIMVDSPAVFAGRFGQGRVLCFSPHPEQTGGLEDFVPRAVVWVSGRGEAQAGQ